ncbi:MAG TPA: hypothetical protein VGE82_03250 [Nitrososphaera sp.]
MKFIDDDGNIIIPKAVRPIIDLQETHFGSKNGARSQYRYGDLHIRDYDSHYSVHMDKVDPMSNPLGHLLVDAPEYLAAATAALIVGKRSGTTVYNTRKKQGKSTTDAAVDAIMAGYVAGSSAGNFVFNIANSLKKKKRSE